MRLKKVVVTLAPEEAQEVLRIDIDRDGEKALQFVCSVLSKRVKEALQTH